MTGKYCSQGTRYRGLFQTLTKEEREEKEEEKDLKTENYRDKENREREDHIIR